MNLSSLSYYFYSEFHSVSPSTAPLLLSGLSTGVLSAIWLNSGSTVTALYLHKQGKVVHLHTATVLGVKLGRRAVQSMWKWTFRR